MQIGLNEFFPFAERGQWYHSGRRDATRSPACRSPETALVKGPFPFSLFLSLLRATCPRVRCETDVGFRAAFAARKLFN